jgi:SAM-dependent methyltransferase/uncharacterized protein YbaR (Trm112 family)
VLPAAILAQLRCPACRGPVSVDSEAVHCRTATCGIRYPVVSDVPVLIDDRQSVFRAADIAAELGAVRRDAVAKPSLSTLIRQITPRIDSNHQRDPALSRLVSLCKTRDQGGMRILAIRGLEGPGKPDLLPRWKDAEMVHAAVLPRLGSAVSCDPQRLPFEDNSFDAVIALNVLHQVPNPVACAEEIHRVLTARGLVYAESPFVQPVHQEVYDFHRFTPLGHRRLFRRFEEIESGVGAGTGAALAWAWQSFWGSLGRSRVAGFALRTWASLTSFFLQRLDPLLKNRPASFDGAASVYFVGRGSAVTLSDQELVAGYRGRVGRYWARTALRPATEVFSTWATAGRDQGMEATHAPAVREMVEAAMSALAGTASVAAIDIGCGNGWVVRMLRKYPACSSVTGVDGSAAMIAKARSMDPEGDYVLADLSEWTPPTRVNLIHGMEVLYYLEDPVAFLRRIRTEWLEPGGIIVLGVDHYAENKTSLGWPEWLGVRMATLSEAEWRAGLCEAGFSEVRLWRAAPRGGAGTLAMLARAPFTESRPAPTRGRDATGGSPAP